MPTLSSASTSNDKNLPDRACLSYVFAGSGVTENWPAEGNPCLAIQRHHEPENSLIDTITSHREHTICISWPLEEDTIAVRCWSATGSLIQFCGHGLLATAALWLKQHNTPSLKLQMNGMDSICQRQQQLLWLDLPILSSSQCPVPDWVEDFFDTSALYAAQAGDKNAYLILQWPDNYPLQQLDPPGQELASFTDRAVIVTARFTNQASPWQENIRFRYFAPQYGVAEDIATGSAMRILTDFWYQRTGMDQLKAYQCSPQGGVLYSQYHESRILVGGTVTAQQEVVL